jgi:hypothetical protein
MNPNPTKAQCHHKGSNIIFSILRPNALKSPYCGVYGKDNPKKRNKKRAHQIDKM